MFLGLAFFCLQVGVFLLSGHRLKNNSRRTLILIQIITGILLIFDGLAYIFRGNTTPTGFFIVQVSNFLVFALNYVATFFFCFYSAEFIKSEYLEFKVLRSPRASVKNGIPIHLYIVFFTCLIGIILTVISQFTDLFYYFDENNLYHRSALFPLSVVLGLLPGLITMMMIFQSKKVLQKNVFISLLIYPLLPIVGIVLALFFYGIDWIDIGYGIGALHLFYSSIKLMELEFYSDKQAGTRLSPNYKQSNTIPEMKRRIVRSHVWQAVSVISGGLLAILIIVSITGISIPERKIVIDKPYLENDKSKPVCVTFLRDAEKVWNDNGDLSRVGAQYNGNIYNNMKATIITDWNVSIDVCADCAIDPGPWNGTFTLTQTKMNVHKPQDNDEGNIHGADYYRVTPLKNLGFGCIMYSPAEFSPLDSKIIFTYESVLKPLSYIIFEIVLGLLSVLFADIVGFTKITSTLDADTVVGALNALYSRIDERAEKNALAIVNFARGMLKDIEDFNSTSNVKLFMRIGINSGSLIAGVIGKTKFVYDIWGDTVNVASRMESSGQTSKIHVSEPTMVLTKGAIAYSEPVEMEIKGKGVMKTYFLM